jgi:hypothetical protein
MTGNNGNFSTLHTLTDPKKLQDVKGVVQNIIDGLIKD